MTLEDLAYYSDSDNELADYSDQQQSIARGEQLSC